MRHTQSTKACKKAAIFCAIILLMSAVTGCSSGVMQNLLGSGNASPATYSDDKYTYAEPMEIDNTYVFEAKLGFNPYLDGAPYEDDIVSLFEDASFTRLIDIRIDFEGLTGKQMTIKPGPGTSILTDSVYQGSDFEIDDWDPGSYEGTWGLYEQMYMVQWCDYDTGEILDKPVVTAVSVKSDLPATTNLQYFATDEGAAGFRWNPVPGAEKYYIVRLDYTASEEIKGGAYLSYAKFIGESTQPEWICENGTPGAFESINEPFYNSNYLFTEGDRGNQSAYSVVAINGSGHSPLSGQIDDAPISSTLPNKMISTTFVPTRIAGIPAMAAVSMCNTDTRYMPIDYDTENMYIANDAGHTALFLPFTVAGTPFKSEFNIININPDTYRQELEEVLAINKGIQSRTGSYTSEVIDDVDTPDSVSTERPEVPDKVFATNPMSDFIAANLIAGNYAMSLEGLPNNTDSHFVKDAFDEARYQNPLVLYADLVNYNSSTKTLVVVPANDVDMSGVAEKQQAIRAEAKRVIGEIIQPGMTDLEKEMAINQYLCDTTEYDYDAYEYQKAAMQLSTEYVDSFNVYGVLVNHKGVCASYAAAFKLLCDEAGLESIVVSGRVFVGGPHAWNRVLIDGEWAMVDVTWNDSETAPNAYFNLPDDVAALTRAEDNGYILDEYYGSYTAQSDANEYYHVTGRFYGLDEVLSVLAQELKGQNSVTLRTDYELSDTQLAQIVDTLTAQLHVQLYGTNSEGVITVRKL